MEIVGFNHDDLTGGGKAPYTFGMKNLMATKRAINADGSNLGGYMESDIKNWISSDLYNSLDVELKNHIKQIKKIVDSGPNTTTYVATVNLFLFSESELMGSSINYQEGVKYARFTGNASRIKYLSNGTGSMSNYWTRTCDNTREYWVGIRGDDDSMPADRYNGDEMYPRVGDPHGVCFGFCV